MTFFEVASKLGWNDEHIETISFILIIERQYLSFPSQMWMQRAPDSPMALFAFVWFWFDCVPITD